MTKRTPTPAGWARSWSSPLASTECAWAHDIALAPAELEERLGVSLVDEYTEPVNPYDKEPLAAFHDGGSAARWSITFRGAPGMARPEVNVQEDDPDCLSHGTPDL